ncbi:hypothetical protein H5410_058961 [Solanum commersonii]|uniref:Uncharacterized protein n=1 Tax=Solanum commersonii TaxID=4109 RepID=A0A9J5W130_SOLCO|nr:hypothetical protein H5410_058961 [Solanum commersonii]
MAFSANPLSLSVPEPVFETWLRDTGYLEILDQRTTDLHRHSSTTAAAATTASSDTAVTNSAAAAVSISNGVLVLIFSRIGTLLSLLTLNPFAKLISDDFSGDTPSWTLQFVGSFDSYSFPSSPSQARLRVHENVKRYARNYASLFVPKAACPCWVDFMFGTLGCIKVMWRSLGIRAAPSYQTKLDSHFSVCYCSYSILYQCSNGSLLSSCGQLCSDDSACLI